nr:hypothetical protein GCM10020241_41210 [Streptoalloteichus tenebrarius]
MKRGVPPTAWKARTGELTPPGVALAARSNRARDAAVFAAPVLVSAVFSEAVTSPSVAAG